ncbi:MAG: hypothetical protein ABI873_15135, partial [Marmoricola sp.]
VANPRQPVALLTGRLPSMRLAPPQPRAAATTRAGSTARRAAVVLVDGALATLPDARATRYRSRLVSVARLVTRPRG